MTEPPQTEERRATLEDPLARLPRVDMAYKVPPSSSPDDDALTVLGTILSGGRSARFYEAIVRQKQLATNVSAGIRREPRARACSTSSALSPPGKRSPISRRRSTTEIERVKTGPIADWEIEKARTGARSGFVNSLGSSLQRAIAAVAVRDVLRRSGPASTRARRASRRSPPPTCSASPRQYLVKTGRTVVAHCAEGRRAGERRPCDDDATRDARRAWHVAAAIVPLAAQQPAPGGQPPPTAGLVKKGKAPVSTESPEGQAAAAAGGGPRQRPAPDGPRGSSAAAGHLPDHHPGRRRLLRSRRADRTGVATPRR